MVLKKFCIEKVSVSEKIGIGKKALDAVLFRFWVTPHTDTIRKACFTQRCILNCSDYSFFKVGATVINTFESWERCLISATNLHGIQKVSPGFQKKCCHLQICNLDIQFL